MTLVFYVFFRCSIILGSWMLDRSRVDFYSDSDKITMTSYTPNLVWSFKSVTVQSVLNSDRYISFSNYSSEDISFNFLLKRGPSFYMVNMVACFILNVTTLIAYFVPLPLQVNICKFVQVCSSFCSLV